MRALLALLVVTSLAAVPLYAQLTEPSPEQSVILDALAAEFMALPATPEGAPDATAWEGQYGRWTVGLSHTTTARESGNPLAIFLVAEGICPDSNEGICYVSILFEFSMRGDPAHELTESVLRYTVISNEGKQVSGYSSATFEGTAKVFAYWVRRDGKWLHHEQDSPEYVVTAKLVNVFLWLVKKVPMHDKQPPSSPPAGAIAS